MERAQRHEVFSANGAYVLVINPQTKQHVVCSVADRRTALWSFSEDCYHEAPAFLSNDGKVAATLMAPFLLEGESGSVSCVRFWNPQGRLKTYHLADLCPDPDTCRPKDRGPAGGNWLIWFRETGHFDDTFVIRTTDLYEYTFSLKDGGIIRQNLMWGNLLVKTWFYVALGLAGLSILSIIWLIRYRRQQRRSPENQPTSHIALQTAAFGYSKRFGHLS
jgi:hypothetical protein